jgi:hypothetical protein
MKHAMNCKFCKKPITVTIDDDYEKMHDPYKLLPMACCNACADNRIERRALERKVQFVVTCFNLAGAKKTEDLIEVTRAKLTILTQAYAGLIARWNGKEGSLWEAEIVDQIIRSPEHWGDTLGHMWRSFREWEKQQQLQPQLNV